MATSIHRWLTAQRTKVECFIDAELGKLAPLVETTMEQHGADVARVIHRLVRASIEVGIIRLVTRLARRHPVTAVALALVGLEVLDEFAQREAHRVADWMVERFIRIGSGQTPADETFLAGNGIDPHHTDPFGQFWAA